MGYTELGINSNTLSKYFEISQPVISKAINQGKKNAKQKELMLLSYIQR